MRVDFYQLSSDPAEVAIRKIATKACEKGERMLVVSADDAQLMRIDEALWAAEDSFLAHGLAGGPHQDRQPILLSDRTDPANGARLIALADGVWRDEALGFDRALLMFDEATVEAARVTWRGLDT
ncbi:MAG TPA: DNA polymerase III subunit chi, partial [Novosphingobium sp.]|nr:DNA polymerase III subunit chi [Novosphingobium sp.]